MAFRGWNLMFTFSVSAPTPCSALRNRKRTCCPWACLLPCYLMEGLGKRNREEVVGDQGLVFLVRPLGNVRVLVL